MTITRGAVLFALDSAYTASLSIPTPDRRASLLRAWAEVLRLKADVIIRSYVGETGQAQGQLEREHARTVFQLDDFADALAQEVTMGHEVASAESPKFPPNSPRMERVDLPIGPVLVFTAGNFPLAFGVAGTDTGSAIAAGCPVIVKSHPVHAATDLLVFRLLKDVLAHLGWNAEWLTLVESTDEALLREVVEHPSVRAVSFTGSLSVGRMIMDIASARDSPIPVYAEMASVNPVVITAGAAVSRGEELADQAAESVLAGNGQFCTKPGLIFVSGSDNARLLASRLARRFAAVERIRFLSPSIQGRHERTVAQAASHGFLVDGGRLTDPSWPAVALMSMRELERHSFYWEEHFGPFTAVVASDDDDAALAGAEQASSLATSIHVADGEAEFEMVAAARLSRISGRVIRNGWPTGVPVTSATVHAGPYPASSTGHTAVGRRAIRRFVRSVSFQNFPELDAEIFGRPARTGAVR